MRRKNTHTHTHTREDARRSVFVRLSNTIYDEVLAETTLLLIRKVYVQNERKYLYVSMSANRCMSHRTDDNNE